MKLTEVTPKPFHCVVGTCPAVFETDRGTHVIVGAQLDLGMIDSLLRGRVGPGETAIEVKSELIMQLLNKT